MGRLWRGCAHAPWNQRELGRKKASMVDFFSVCSLLTCCSGRVYSAQCFKMEGIQNLLMYFITSKTFMLSFSVTSLRSR